MESVFLITSQYLGGGSDRLGEKLMSNFLKKLWSQEHKPECIIFYNSGVKLLAKDSSVLDALDGLNTSGVELIACGTCCTHFEIADELAIGRISDMQEIVTLLNEADKVVTV